MNKTKLKVYKRVHQDVCEKFDEAEQFINKKIKEKRFSLLLKKLKKKEIKENKIISERGNLFCLRKLEVCCSLSISVKISCLL